MPARLLARTIRQILKEKGEADAVDDSVNNDVRTAGTGDTLRCSAPCHSLRHPALRASPVAATNDARVRLRLASEQVRASKGAWLVACCHAASAIRYAEPPPLGRAACGAKADRVPLRHLCTPRRLVDHPCLWPVLRSAHILPSLLHTVAPQCMRCCAGASAGAGRPPDCHSMALTHCFPR